MTNDWFTAEHSANLKTFLTSPLGDETRALFIASLVDAGVITMLTLRSGPAGEPEFAVQFTYLWHTALARRSEWRLSDP